MLLILWMYFWYCFIFGLSRVKNFRASFYFALKSYPYRVPSSSERRLFACRSEVMLSDWMVRLCLRYPAASFTAFAKMR